jgi:hypothetical protein
MCSMMLPLLLGAASALADSDRDDHGVNNRSLKGDYAFTGSASCLNSVGGFTASFLPIGANVSTTNFMAQGIRTFNGDGTGTVHDAYTISLVVPPVVTPSASSFSYSESFTYEVQPDGSVTFTLDGPLTATETAGPAPGLTVSEVGILQQGRISADGATLTTGAVSTPTVETLTFSTGFVEQRICTRSFTLIKLKRDHDEH